ncbi:MAG: NTP transferase domain-containing protein [Gammaproteobacteria bacterium]|nr:NTP transferase domain-containing protein [Gammaproteobacteria bacterium]
MQGWRIGGIDKPLIRVSNRYLLEHALERLVPQVSGIVLSVGANDPAYREFGCELVADEEAGEGPLAGLFSAFRDVKTKWALTLPEDTPRPAPNLVQCLAVHRWFAEVALPSSDLSDLAPSFFNINTPEDLAALRRAHDQD